MVGLIHHRHAPRHARTSPAATSQPPAAGLPERFWPLREHAERVARGTWTDPAHEDMIASLRREFERWQREQRRA